MFEWASSEMYSAPNLVGSSLQINRGQHDHASHLPCINPLEVVSWTCAEELVSWCWAAEERCNRLESVSWWDVMTAFMVLSVFSSIGIFAVS